MLLKDTVMCSKLKLSRDPLFTPNWKLGTLRKRRSESKGRGKGPWSLEIFTLEAGARSLKDPSQARLCYCFDLKFAIKLLIERDKKSTVQLVKI